MKLTRRGLVLLTATIATSGLLLGMNVGNVSCAEDEVLVFDNNSHSKCVHIDVLSDWMNEQND